MMSKVRMHIIYADFSFLRARVYLFKISCTEISKGDAIFYLEIIEHSIEEEESFHAFTHSPCHRFLLHLLFPFPGRSDL